MAIIDVSRIRAESPPPTKRLYTYVLIAELATGHVLGVGGFVQSNEQLNDRGE
jgi:hypothetical protein